MAAKKEDLTQAVDKLERVLETPAAAGAPEQAARLDRALSRLEEAIGLHLGTLYQPDGLVGAVERPRLPSPAVDRDTAHLSDELERLQRELRELRAKLPAPGQAVADWTTLFRRARELAAALERFGDKEAHLILESVNLDLGAGD